jgi:hypothetical protein
MFAHSKKIAIALRIFILSGVVFQAMNAFAQLNTGLSFYAPPRALGVFEVTQYPGRSAHDLKERTLGPIYYSYTVAPSHAVVANQPVEHRISIQNTSWTTQDVSLQLYGNNYPLSLYGQYIRLEPWVSYSIRFWHQPASGYFSGRIDYTMMIQSASHGYKTATWPIYVFPAQPVAGSATVATTAYPSYQVAWIEPGNLFAGFYGRTIFPDVYLAYLRHLKSIGVRTLVLAYSEYNIGSEQCAYYKNTGFSGYPFCSRLAIYDYMGSAYYDVATGTTHDVSGGFDVVERTLSYADQLNMKVIIGLGKAQDENFGVDLAAYLFMIPSATINGPLSANLEARKQNIIQKETQVATDIWRSYGNHKSFYGFYLTHETNCLDHLRIHNYDPLAREIRRIMPPDKLIMVSPPLLSQACTSGQSLASEISQLEADIVAYQDGAGAGIAPNYAGYPTTTWNAWNAIYSMPTYFAQRALAHAQTNKHIWSNLELWRMTGVSGYSSNGAYSGTWYEASTQINSAAPYVGQIMVNEGLRYFYPSCQKGLKLPTEPIGQSYAAQAWYDYDLRLRPAFATPMNAAIP